MKKYIKMGYLWKISLAIALILSTTIGASAEEAKKDTAPEASCSKAQVLLVIDQSGSMINNDPTRLRFDGALKLADNLAASYINAYNRNQSYADEIPIEIEMAVIWFGSTATVQLEWTPINPINQAAWTSMRAQLAKKLDLEYNHKDPPFKDIGNGTNFIKAIELAQELYGRTTAQEDGCPMRLVMLLTDGNPDKDGNPLKGDDLEKHMEEVGDLVDQLLPNLEDGQDVDNTKRGTVFYVTAFNNRNDNYWTDSKEYWEDITEHSLFIKPETELRAEKADDSGDLGRRLSAIVLKFLGDPAIVVINPGRIVVPPYLERYTLTFYKAELTDLLYLWDGNPSENGVLIDENSPEYTLSITGDDQNSGIQTIDWLNPPPGEYWITTDAQQTGFVITKQEVFARPRLKSPVSALQQFITGDITVEMVDSLGNVVSNPNYELVSTASINGPGMEIPLSLGFTPNGNVSGRFTPIEAGEHILVISATTRDFDNKDIFVIEEPGSPFNIFVNAVTVLDGKAENINPTCPPAQYSPFIVPLQVIEANSGEEVFLASPVTWDIDTNDDIEITISVDENDQTELNAVSDVSGEVSFTISASAANPVDGQLLEFYSKDFTLDVQPGQKFSFEVVGANHQPGGVGTFINKQLDKLFGRSEVDAHLIFRRFLMLDQEISFLASLTENSSPLSGQPDSLPAIFLLPETEDPQLSVPYYGDGWESTDDPGVYIETFSRLPPGDYTLRIDEATTPCGIQLDSKIAVGPSLRLTSDMGEKLVILLIFALTFYIVYLIFMFVACRFMNPLEGYIAIVDGDGYRVWYQSIYGRSCWNFGRDLNDPKSYCYFVDIKIRGWYLRNGKFSLRYVYIDPVTGKKVRGKKLCNPNSWTHIPGPGACQIWFARAQEELPAPR